MPYADPTVRAEYLKRYRAEHRGACAAADAEWRRCNPERVVANGRRKVNFLGRRVMLPINPRTGVCSQRGAQATTRQHALHHDEYDVDNPAAHTRELCPKCHVGTHIGGFML